MRPGFLGLTIKMRLGFLGLTANASRFSRFYFQNESMFKLRIGLNCIKVFTASRLKFCLGLNCI